MAKNNTEIEIKTPVSRADFLRIRTYLEKEARFVKSSHQIDTYYSPLGKLFLKPKYPYEWLSIRERGGKVAINYKYWHPEGKRVVTHCDEFETEVSDKAQTEKIFKALKLEKLVAVEKDRSVYVKTGLEIALDQVKDLGYFVEIESLDNRGGVEKTMQKILKFAKSKLKITKLIDVQGGYAAELMRRKGMTR